MFHRHDLTNLIRIAAGVCLVLSSLGVLAWNLTTLSQNTAYTMSMRDCDCEHEHTNHLVNETSPYLLQHAHNPVNWHPWGEEAFELARKQNKPIFLSVGYSTCHWCHVMERESFVNEEVAEVINKNFVPIKVDREQRPDVDKYYMLATQLMTGRGGWPNSVWLTPEGEPWMAGTYYPREEFISLLNKLAEIWSEQPQAVAKRANSLAKAIERVDSGQLSQVGQKLGPELLQNAFDRMKTTFDEEYGGFGGAPKFPPHGDLRLLVRELRESESGELRRILTGTLDKMWQGGIHDHIGGGFHRYSTDERWFLPHFEKMLYDNAQLTYAYADAYEITGDPRYRKAVADIFGWLRREMTHPDGGYYSALDSESEGEEGQFYVWSTTELREVLGEKDAELFADVYGFQPEGNFTEEATGRRPGTNIPYLPRSIDVVAEDLGMQVEQLDAKLTKLRRKLRKIRNDRPYPHLDDKILASWNGLMISALARAGGVFEQPEYTQAASRAADFVLEKMRQDGKLLRSWREGTANLPGYLDDYAYFADGLIELYRTTGDERWLKNAEQLTETMIEEFHDPRNGGFFFSSEDHSERIARSKNLTGGGNVPVANGVAIKALLDLSSLSNNARYEELAAQSLKSLTGAMAQSNGSESLLLAADIYLDRMKTSSDSLAKRPAEKSDAVYEKLPISAKLTSSKQNVSPGEKFHLTIQVKIEEGWHLYGTNPHLDSIVETTAKLADVAEFQSGTLQRPEGTRKEDSVLGKSLEVYEGEIRFRLPVTVAEDASPGSKKLKVQFHSQACDASRCLPAESATLSLTLNVKPK